MKLYYHPYSPNCRHPLAVAHHTGQRLDLEVVDLLAGGTRSPDYLARNPNGMVPTLVDDELTLWESNVISTYLAQKAGGALLPSDPVDRLRHDGWLYWRQGHWGRHLGTLTWENYFRSLMGKTPNERKVDDATKGFRRFAEVLDTHLGGRTYIMGDAVTVADYAIASNLTFHYGARVPLADYRHISGWYARVEELPAWKETVPR